ncbi:hypothetical protein [Mucilaginibacter segetis]|uniref:Type II CBASS E2 protein domain-containing protein n=1 Tax=Mucilaginibacter segetis TaxID=2793071 RepID=A0A934PUM6_9SPHI|nr:hypothetical protein [Mucilaginibacter segetis]MBK0379333.1 hypothetical protein [Mucilaginibacter segetis]
MAVKNLIPERRLNPAHLLRLEMALLRKHYGFLSAKLVGGVLYVYGYCQPTEYSITYHYKVVYDPKSVPKVYVTEPEIAYKDDIHMYSDDHRLCLYYPPDHSWTEHSRLFDTIIPWTHKWFLYYEIYLISGKWEHPFVEHRKL